MGMPAKLTQSGTGRSTIWYPDWARDPFNIGVGCFISTGTATYNVEHAFDDPQVVAVNSFTWFQNSGISGVSASSNGNYAFPVRAISINVTAGAGTVVVNLIQAGIGQ